MLRPVLVTPPAETPITVGELKEHVRQTGNEEDAVFEGFIQAATAYLDGYSGILGRCLVTQTWTQAFDAFPAGNTIRLPFPDVSAVTVTYRDANNASQTLSAAAYSLTTDEGGSVIVLGSDQSWPDTYARPDAVTVSMTAGYGDAADVPAILRHAVKTLAAAMYEGREGQSTGTPAFDAFIAPYRHHQI